jgi:hypothetical protein
MSKLCLLPASSWFFFCLAYSLALKMEMTPSFETLVDLQLITRRFVPEDRTLLLD